MKINFKIPFSKILSGVKTLASFVEMIDKNMAKHAKISGSFYCKYFDITKKTYFDHKITGTAWAQIAQKDRTKTVFVKKELYYN